MAASNLLLAQTTNATGALFGLGGLPATIQARVIGTGAVAATVTIQVSNFQAAGNPSTGPATADWQTLGTITLSGTTQATDGFATQAPWLFVRAVISGISGTGATVDCRMVTGGIS